MFPLLYWDANREWVTLFAGGCNQQPEMHMMAEGTRYLATSRYLAKSPILPLFWGLVFHVWWISWPTNIIKNEELDVHLPRTEKETSHENNIFCGLKQIITKHTFLDMFRFNPMIVETLLVDSISHVKSPSSVKSPKDQNLLGDITVIIAQKLLILTVLISIITVIIIIISCDWLMDYILRLVIG